MTRIGSLCTGYGGLDMALDGDTVWVSDIDKHAAKLLAHRFPTVPNLGDLTAVDWEAVEPVDIITAGYPCQPFSHAGKREGQNDERHIWPHIANAIRVLRPGHVFLENVAGHLSLGLGDVLADLAKAGYDTEWVCVRASDVGAPHRRERVFILATDTGRGVRREDYPERPADQRQGCLPTGRDEGASRFEHGCPTAADAKRERLAGRGTTGDVPQTASGAESQARERQRCRDAANDSGRRAGDATDSEGVGRAEGWTESAPGRDMPTWGAYAPAVERWERFTGRAAPAPTTTGNTGRAVLNPPFVEWMMGLPAGWVTDVPGIPRTQQLKILGNGVVPQQAGHALNLLTATEAAACPNP